MNMKRIFAVLLIILLLSGCGAVDEIGADDFLSAEEAGQYLDFVPVAFEENTRLCKTVIYQNEVVGKSDPVKVEVYPFNQKHDKAEIKRQFEAEKSRNEALERTIAADEVGVEAFIAIPAIHLYQNGYYVVISAGSGAGEHQVTLLKNYGKIAAEHLAEIAGEEEQKDNKE